MLNNFRTNNSLLCTLTLIICMSYVYIALSISTTKIPDLRYIPILMDSTTPVAWYINLISLDFYYSTCILIADLDKCTFLFQALAYTVLVSFEYLHGLCLGALQEGEQWLQVFSLPPAIPVHFAGGWYIQVDCRARVMVSQCSLQQTWYALLVMSGISC